MLQEIVGKKLDAISKLLSRAKTVGIIVLILFFVISITQNGCDRQRVSDLTKVLTGLDIQNDLLLKSVSSLDSVLIAKEDSIQFLLDSTEVLGKEVITLKFMYAKKARELEKAVNRIGNISVDSSYLFLIHTAYPYIGENKYKLNALQIKGIHRTFVSNSSLVVMNTNLKAQNLALNQQVALTQEAGNIHKSKGSIMHSKELAYKTVISNKTLAIEEQSKEIDKTKRRENWKKAGIAVGSLLLGILIGN